MEYKRESLAFKLDKLEKIGALNGTNLFYAREQNGAYAVYAALDADQLKAHPSETLPDADFSEQEVDELLGTLKPLDIPLGELFYRLDKLDDPAQEEILLKGLTDMEFPAFLGEARVDPSTKPF